MALVNDTKKEINAKIVYLGPKGAGKATALRFIYSRLKPDCRSELKTMATGAHQMLFFDFSYPLPQRSDGYNVRFHIYTLIAGDDSPLPWKMLLKGADGAILFADSASGRMYANLESCALLFDAFAHYGVPAGSVPVSLQCNKRDLQGVLALDEMKSELLPEMSGEPLPVTAISGGGLLSGLNAVIRDIMHNLGQEAPAAEMPAEPVAGSASQAPAGGDEAAASGGHCVTGKTAFAVESAGEPTAVANGTIIIPLRLTGGECGKSIDFTVTVSVTL